MVKLDLDTLPTVPDDPPAAGPDRALDPPPAELRLLAGLLANTGCVADAAGEVAKPTESPITGDIAAATNSNRRILRRGCLEMVTETNPLGEHFLGRDGTAPVLPPPRTTDGPGATSDTDSAEKASPGAGQRVDHAASRKKDLSSLGEVDREVGNRVALDRRCVIAGFHEAPPRQAWQLTQPYFNPLAIALIGV